MRNPGISVAALTGTATSITIDVIKNSFFLKEPKLTRLLCLRKNLAFNCVLKEMKPPQQNIFDDVYENLFGQCGIIYCNTQNKACELAFMLKQKGISSTYYHRGLERGEKIVNAHLWLDDKIYTICCTSAFGMGIDKKDVRYVIRFSLPATIEQLAQEGGCTGRDSNDAICNFYYNISDRTFHFRNIASLCESCCTTASYDPSQQGNRILL